MFKKFLLISVFCLSLKSQVHEFRNRHNFAQVFPAKPNNEVSLVNIKITHLSFEIGKPINIKSLKEKEHLKIISGMSLTVRCRVTGKPEPTVYWMKNSKKLDSNEEDRIFTTKKNEAVLHFPSISLADSSNYSCKASNSNGFINKWFQIKVIQNDSSNDQKDDWTTKLNIKPCSENSRCQFRDCKILDNMVACRMRCEISKLSSSQMPRKSCPTIENPKKIYCLQKYQIIFALILIALILFIILCLFWYSFRAKINLKINTHQDISRKGFKLPTFQLDSEEVFKDLPTDVLFNCSNKVKAISGQEKSQFTEIQKEDLTCFRIYERNGNPDEPLVVNGYCYLSNNLK